MNGNRVMGNKVLSGTWGELWLNGEKIFELSKVELKVITNREEVQLGIDVDSKLTGLKGEGTIVVKKAFTRAMEIVEKLKQGIDMRSQIITKLKDPDAAGGQTERWAVNNVWFNEATIAAWEKGAIIEEEYPLGFTPSDMECLDKIKIK